MNEENYSVRWQEFHGNAPGHIDREAAYDAWKKSTNGGEQVVWPDDDKVDPIEQAP